MAYAQDQPANNDYFFGKGKGKGKGKRGFV